MTNIFNFRPIKKDAPGSDFLKDADDTVEFGPTGRDVSFNKPPEHYLQGSTGTQFIPRDWTNQELANIYRVKRLLDAAGVPNTLERGITDEGDPWYIFCTLNGDVFIHLCRVDGRYVLDSPNLRQPLSGIDFNDMIMEFSDGALCNTPAAKKGDLRVIKLQRNGKVFLHPSALLAALIWSIYLNSEDLVMFAPDQDAADSDDPDNIALINETALAPLIEEEATTFMSTTAMPDHIVGTRLAEEATIRGDDLREGAAFKDLTASKSVMMLAPTPIAVGLSSIAIAFGLATENFFDPDPVAEAVSLEQPMEDGSLEGPIAEDGGESGGARVGSFDLAAVLQAAFDQPPSLEQSPSALHAELSAGINLSTVLAAILGMPAQTDLPMYIAEAVQSNWVDELPEPELFSVSAKDKKLIDTSEKEKAEKAKQTVTQQLDNVSDPIDVVIVSGPTAVEYSSLLDFKVSVSSAFKTFDFAGLTIEATFDLASISPMASDLLLGSALEQPNGESNIPDSMTDNLSESDTVELPSLNTAMPDVLTAQQTASFSEIDVNARSFIEYLMSQAKEVEVLALSREIILIDFEALQAQSGDTFSMSWSLADGGTVSTIGLKSDFEEYDLIA